MKNKCQLLLLRACAFLMLAPVFSNAHAAYDLAGVAGSMIESVVFMSDFVQTACFVIGGAFLFTSIIKYVEHKRSPLMVPIGTVIFLLVAGILLILLPFFSYFVDNDVSSTLMK